MKEIVGLHLGQAGCQVGEKLWELLCEEHGIKPDGTSDEMRVAGDPMGAFFSQTPNKQFVPRAVFCDSDPMTTEALLGPQSRFKDLFNPDDILTYKQDAKGNFFEGRRQAVEYRMTDAVLDRLRVHSESCDNLAGFFVYHSFGGGTGTGLGVEVLEAIKENFGKALVFEPVIYPSKELSANVVEPYNCLFATAYTRETAALSIMLDNQGAYHLCRKRLGIERPCFRHMNSLIAQMVSGSTASLRFDSMLNANLDEIITNLVPDPTLHYALLSVAPLNRSSRHGSFSTKQIINDLFEPANFLADVSAPNYLKNNRYLAASVLLRGTGDSGEPLQAGEAVQAVHAVSGSSPKNRVFRAPSAKFVNWLPNGFKVGIVGVPPHVPKDLPSGQLDRQAVLLANTTAVRSLFVRQYQKFLKLFFHKSFIWQFLEAGGEMDLFYEAKDSVQEILQRYKDVLDSCASAESDGQLAALAEADN